jgi:hypothetical protein
MTYNEKLGYVLAHCEIEEREKGAILYTEGIVGNFAGRSFTGKDVSNCVRQCVGYFDKETQTDYKDNNDSMVKIILKDIGW